MSITSYLLGIAAALLLLFTVVEMLRRGKLRERHTIWWLVAGVLGLIGGVFPAIIDGLAGLLGVAIPINLVFFVCIVVLFLVCIQQSSELTQIEERTRTLAEEVALLNNRVSQYEQDPRSDEGPSR